MTVKKAIYEVETSQGFTRLINHTVYSKQRPLLFIHGFGSDQDIWFKNEEAIGNYFLDRGYNIWVLELSKSVTGNLKSLAYGEVFNSINYIYFATHNKVRIICHSMGGVITRLLVSDHIDHPYDLNDLINKIEGITLLGVPNHGIRTPKLILKLKQFLTRFNDTPTELETAMVQLLDSSDFIKELNLNEAKLNPKIKWQNAVAIYDQVVEVDSARFTESEIEGVDVIQEEFPCDHMKYPLSTNTTIKRVLDSLTIQLYPPIHSYQPVAEWIEEDLTKV